MGPGNLDKGWKKQLLTHFCKTHANHTKKAVTVIKAKNAMLAIRFAGGSSSRRDGVRTCTEMRSDTQPNDRIARARRRGKV